MNGLFNTFAMVVLEIVQWKNQKRWTLRKPTRLQGNYGLNVFTTRRLKCPPTMTEIAVKLCQNIDDKFKKKKLNTTLHGPGPMLGRIAKAKQITTKKYKTELAMVFNQVVNMEVKNRRIRKNCSRKSDMSASHYELMCDAWIQKLSQHQIKEKLA